MASFDETKTARLDAQYRTAANLQARIALHERFATEGTPWVAWVFEQLTAPEDCRLLEVGCGPATLWRENLTRIPPGWELTLTDRSPGMVAEARRALEASGRAFQFQVADVTALPFADATFDAVVANHMLYHVERRDRALAEIARVLRPGGVLYAATNGDQHLGELRELIQSFAPELGYRAIPSSFSLENGAAQVAPWFEPIVLRRHASDLAVTEVEPVVAYFQSTMTGFHDAITGDRLDAFRRLLARRIADGGGALRVTRASGLFIATKR